MSVVLDLRLLDMDCKIHEGEVYGGSTHHYILSTQSNAWHNKYVLTEKKNRPESRYYPLC